MYKKAIYTLRSNERLTPAVWRMTLEGDTQWITAPGQFVNVDLGLRLGRTDDHADL